METTNQISTSEQIMQIFRKIAPLLNKKHFDLFEAELRKIVPSENSEVTIMPGYSDRDNRTPISIYVRDPLLPENVADWHFDQIIPLWLSKTDEESVAFLLKCLLLMENKEGRKYTIGGIEPHLNPDLNEYYFNFAISKR